MKKIAQIILAVVIVALVYVIYDQISTPIRFEQEMKAKKAQVIDRIKDIRTAQRAFKSKYQRFTGSFDTLASFILNDSLELERKIVDEDDSVAMAMLKKMNKKNVEKFTVAVIDTIFSPKRLSRQDVEDLRYIPTTDKQAQFIMEAGSAVASNVTVPIVECRAPYKMFLDTVAYRQEIINLIDDEENNFNRYAGVKFGSMEAANNEAGTWEYHSAIHKQGVHSANVGWTLFFGACAVRGVSGRRSRGGRTADTPDDARAGGAFRRRARRGTAGRRRHGRTARRARRMERAATECRRRHGRGGRCAGCGA